MAHTTVRKQMGDTPKDVVTSIGKEYVEAEKLLYEDSENVERIYGRIADTVKSLFDSIRVPVIFQSEDPYDDYQDMKETVTSEETLRVYDEHASHPVMTDEQNLKFRAVHDWFGHLSADVDFSPEGEFRKWQHMKQHFEWFENRVMFAEVVGQLGAVHYLDDGFESDRYVQRAFIAPERWIRCMKNVA